MPMLMGQEKQRIFERLVHWGWTMPSGLTWLVIAALSPLGGRVRLSTRNPLDPTGPWGARTEHRTGAEGVAPCHLRQMPKAHSITQGLWFPVAKTRGGARQDLPKRLCLGQASLDHRGDCGGALRFQIGARVRR